MTTSSLTILFEATFWIGLFERTDQEAEKQRQFDLRQIKKKEKHKGH